MTKSILALAAAAALLAACNTWDGMVNGMGKDVDSAAKATQMNVVPKTKSDDKNYPRDKY